MKSKSAYKRNTRKDSIPSEHIIQKKNSNHIELSYDDLIVLGFKATKSDRQGDHFHSKTKKYKDIHIIADYKGFTIIHKKPWFNFFPHTIEERKDTEKFISKDVKLEILKKMIDDIIELNNRMMEMKGKEKELS